MEIKRQEVAPKAGYTECSSYIQYSARELWAVKAAVDEALASGVPGYAEVVMSPPNIHFFWRES